MKKSLIKGGNKKMTIILGSNVFRKEVIIKDMKLNISQIARDQGNKLAYC